MRDLPYEFTDIKKITQFKTWTDRQKIDEMLRIDCNLYAQLGIDSNKADKEDVKKKSRVIYKTIKTIDKNMGESFLQAMDKPI
jgi:hypothetical protein|tara:strand:+ start:912 stop:1160 length:249 start_codon:yes stop_codon:yes gene_type:complete